MYEIKFALHITITGDIQIEIIGATFLLRKIVLMSCLEICGVVSGEPVLDDTVTIFSPRLCVGEVFGWGGVLTAAPAAALCTAIVHAIEL